MARIDHRDRVPDLPAAAIERAYAAALAAVRGRYHIDPWQQRGSFRADMLRRGDNLDDIGSYLERDRTAYMRRYNKRRWAIKKAAREVA